VGTTASFCIDIFDVDHSQTVTWDYSSLVKTETVLLLGLCFVHESFLDFMALVDYAVGFILYVQFLLLCQTLIMSDI
jgi:hypothetical protein